jgi:putative N6-adenine-specific DNA methylase
MRIFIVINPGLEDLAYEEIKEKCPLTEFEMIKGGILAEVDHQWIFNAHKLLKIPTRILLRITEFKVRDFPKLLNKLSSLKWNEFLSHPEPEFEISASKSRLLHTGRIEEIARLALSKHLEKQPLSLDWKKKNFSPQTFYIRLNDDLLTLSVDLSGEALYKRGLGIIKGEAPLRETIASALIFDIFQGIKEEVTLFDPMCGSGTFLYEAQDFYLAGKRTFSFSENPMFKGKHYPTPKLERKLPIKEMIGHEINEALVAKLNFPFIKAHDSLLSDYQISSPSIIICNPPYGERIKIQGKRGHFLKDTLKHLFTLKPIRLGWLVPTDMEEIFKAPASYRLLGKRRFRNGGLAVSFMTWEKITE